MFTAEVFFFAWRRFSIA